MDVLEHYQHLLEDVVVLIVCLLAFIEKLFIDLLQFLDLSAFLSHFHVEILYLSSALIELLALLLLLLGLQTDELLEVSDLTLVLFLLFLKLFL